MIEIQTALTSTKDGQKAMQEFQSRFEPRKKDLDKKASDLRELQDRLQRGGAAMSDAAKQDLTRTIEVKTKSYNRDMEDANAEFEQDRTKVLDELGQKMVQVIDKYAVANGYAVIIDVSNPQTPVMYASMAVNITKDIVDLYDKTIGVSAPRTSSTRSVTPLGSPAARPAATPVKKQP